MTFYIFQGQRVCLVDPVDLTLFQQHKRRLYTWTSPDGQHQNQIDPILCILILSFFPFLSTYSLVLFSLLYSPIDTLLQFCFPVCALVSFFQVDIIFGFLFSGLVYCTLSLLDCFIFGLGCVCICVCSIILIIICLIL